ncbi:MULTISPECIES: DNA-deoxyinosine glycosylase [Mycobacteriaceae]|uniref:DNA-deoxyinosine glycosylase n=1 Tax=Mycobacteriaceae TaxID=1762 RepID=UPI001E4DE9F2|nr:MULTISPECIES: DNA-deoxyinosine glycosylase [Mycobacteriaceae]MCK0173162.1 DNA-deoxyinosine glycosylase [Mycolicibacterium sp. F2034L]
MRRIDDGEAPLLHGFPPIVGADPRVLILGNAPSVLALARVQYYGNPQNAFWRITGELYGFDPADPYEQRTAALIAHGVAVWDVLASCRRKGSLDSAVEPKSMVANDFHTFFEAHPTIRRVLFNGAAAEKNFHRLVRGDFGVPFERLPSTSPAQTMRYAAKLAAWRAALAR